MAIWAAVVLGIAAVLVTRPWEVSAPPPLSPLASAGVEPFKSWIPFHEAQPLFAAWPAHVPADLRAKSQADRAAAWPDWMLRHDAAIRARLDRGDEDSVVNFWLYGTTFTTLPRATARGLARAGGLDRTSSLVEARLDDLLNAVAAPGGNGRVRFARSVLARRGIDVAAPGGRDRAWEYLDSLRTRMAQEESGYGQTAAAVQGSVETSGRLSTYATLYEERGLSSDTGMPIGFALERSLADLKAGGRLKPGTINRVGIVGPGLDFTDKAEGYDFYPQQSIQPFALIDSLLRLELASTGDLIVTTLDISHRVTSHLQAAREQADQGAVYTLHFPLDPDTPGRQWQPALVAYWQRVGDRIGEVVPGVTPPPGLEQVRVRAVAVRPQVVRQVQSQNVNVILERLDPLAEAERFDLVVATNVLVYYDPFEQALALTNISRMLRPGGFLITSDAMFPTAPMDTVAAQITRVDRDHQGQHDMLFAYQRH
jgi:SAM-dependent methyltransferase